jgi:hypothetical protein
MSDIVKPDILSGRFRKAPEKYGLFSEVEKERISQP